MNYSVDWDGPGERDHDPVERDELLKALYDLAHADALEGVIPLVAGWNGPPEKPYSPHPPQLGAQIKTTCGRVVKLADAIKAARAVLYRANAVRNINK